MDDLEESLQTTLLLLEIQNHKRKISDEDFTLLVNHLEVVWDYWEAKKSGYKRLRDESRQERNVGSYARRDD